MTAEYTAERDWFLREVVQSATTLNIKLEKQEVWRILEDFLLISSEAGLQFARMVRSTKGLSGQRQ